MTDTCILLHTPPPPSSSFLFLPPSLPPPLFQIFFLKSEKKVQACLCFVFVFKIFTRPRCFTYCNGHSFTAHNTPKFCYIFVLFSCLCFLSKLRLTIQSSQKLLCHLFNFQFCCISFLTASTFGHIHIIQLFFHFHHIIIMRTQSFT